MLIHNKDDIEFVPEFPCLLGQPLSVQLKAHNTRTDHFYFLYFYFSEFILLNCWENNIDNIWIIFIPEDVLCPSSGSIYIYIYTLYKQFLVFSIWHTHTPSIRSNSCPGNKHFAHYWIDNNSQMKNKLNRFLFLHLSLCHKLCFSNSNIFLTQFYIP